jgi:hypothetical protein
MVAEDLLFWIVATDADTPSDAKLLCRRHADAMVVPRGWTLDDRRQPTPSLFQTRRYDTKASVQAAAQAAALAANPPSARRQMRRVGRQAVEQLQIDGTGPTERPTAAQLAALDDTPADIDHPDDISEVDEVARVEAVDDADHTDNTDDTDDTDGEPVTDGTNFGAWRPEFDTDDDLDGLLESKSPLLARAFRGTARQR